jgi:hypothetical protein
MYDCSFLPVWINGAPMQTGYLGGLRVNPGYRHRLSVLRNGFSSIPALLKDEIAGLSLWFTSIASDNRAARRILEAGLKGMPRYSPIGELETLVISTRRAKRRGLLRQATPRDIPAIADFHGRQAAEYQFSPYLSETWLQGLSGASGLRIEDFWLLEDNSGLLGCIALWDQRAFKQTVVDSYRFPLAYLRLMHNLIATMTGKPSLPPAGAPLESVFLAFFACSQAASDSAVDMLREALYLVKQRGARLGVIGLSVQNPWLSTLRSALRPLVYRTCIEGVALQGTQAFIADRRPPQPEIAVL